mmetsp:Transcript_5495/g.17804  ORF Transcript_5495/g.17804 Transcript_5495/m.17804 type:complete len:223 (+) Transcript_5495:818-1486(+)
MEPASASSTYTGATLTGRSFVDGSTPIRRATNCRRAAPTPSLFPAACSRHSRKCRRGKVHPSPCTCRRLPRSSPLTSASFPSTRSSSHRWRCRRVIRGTTRAATATARSTFTVRPSRLTSSSTKALSLALTYLTPTTLLPTATRRRCTGQARRKPYNFERCKAAACELARTHSLTLPWHAPSFLPSSCTGCSSTSTTAMLTRWQRNSPTRRTRCCTRGHGSM